MQGKTQSLVFEIRNDLRQRLAFREDQVNMGLHGHRQKLFVLC